MIKDQRTNRRQESFVIYHRIFAVALAQLTMFEDELSLTTVVAVPERHVIVNYL